MRPRFITTAALIFAATTASAAEVIPPRVDERAYAAADQPAVDRTSMRSLARFSATTPRPRVEPNLLSDGDVARLAEPIEVVLPATPPSGTAGIGTIAVEGAASLRLHVEAPSGTMLWVAGSEDDAFEPFQPSPTAQWTPTTRGSVVYIAAGSSGERLRISAFAHQAATAAASNSCLQDVACTDEPSFPERDAASRAIAQIRFVRGTQSFVCSGGLVNDSTNSGTPYLLTAHHCIATPEEAASVEIVWDFRSSACGSSRSGETLRSYGAELLVSSPQTDVALLKLASVPAGRVYLGIERRPLAPGTATHRISHPGGQLQVYSASTVAGDGEGCPSAPRPRFIYSRPTRGSVASGSSGAPLLVGGLLVAGQLRGLCGADPTNPCAVFNDVVDGSIAEAWPLLAPYLDPKIPARRQSAKH